MIEFGQPLALLSGIALGMPILAHLAYRSITNKRLFSSLRFISPTNIPRSGRKRPSDWILLLLRVLMFLTITGMLSDPYWKGFSKPESQKTLKESRLHLLDCSLSMSGWGAWNEAVGFFCERLSDKGFDNGLLAWTEDGLMEWPCGTSVEELIKAVRQLKPVYVRSKIDAMLERATALASVHGKDGKILLYSDFQTSDWQDAQGSLSTTGWEPVLVPCGHGSLPWSDRLGNRAIVDARVMPGSENKINVWSVLRNWDRNSSELKVSIMAGGDVRQSRKIILPARGTEQVQFTLPASDFASVTIFIEGEDACHWDDNRSIWVAPPPVRKFGILTKQSHDEKDAAESEFLQAVFESAGDGLWDRWVLEQNLESLDCLLIPGFSGWMLDEKQLPNLSDHLQAGKIALLTPGESFARMTRCLNESNLLNFSFQRVARTEWGIDPYRIEALRETSPLYEVFDGNSVRDLYLAQIRKFLVLRDWEDSAESPVFDRSGRPLAILREFPGGGRIVLLCFRLLPDWTDLPTRNSFLPLLVELCGLNQDEGQDRNQRSLTSGDFLKKDDFSFTAKEPGLFQWMGKRLEVYPSLTESMPEVLSRADAMESVSGAVGFSDSLVPEISRYPQKKQDGMPLWMWFALVACLLLFVEMILSALPVKVPSVN